MRDFLMALAGTEIGRQPPAEFVLLRFGKNGYVKGGESGEIEFTEADADAVIADFSARGKDLVIDYEHQTLHGDKAPAAGWINSLKKTGEGLVATINYWTDAALSMLKAGEYRYHSPVLRFDKAGKRVKALHSVALTNHPALRGMPALVASDDSDAQSVSDIKLTNGAKAMNEEMLKLLGLTDESKAVEAIKTLTSVKVATDDFLRLHDAPSLDALTLRIQAMVPAAEKTRLEGEIKKRDAADAVNLAMSEGKIAENKKSWALGFAERDLSAFNELMKDAPRVVPDNQNTDPAPESAGKVNVLSDTDKKIMRSLGLTDEQIEQASKEGK